MKKKANFGQLVRNLFAKQRPTTADTTTTANEKPTLQSTFPDYFIKPNKENEVSIRPLARILSKRS